MVRDLLITALCTLNILLFTFLGLNEEALRKLMDYETPSISMAMPFDELIVQTQRRITLQRKNVSPAHTMTDETFLVIPKINVISPIAVAEEKEKINPVLAAGTLSLEPFVSPPNYGQTIIFGHSSDYAWNNNPYATVFTLLGKLVPGDQVRIIQKDNNFLYTVQRTVISDADLTSVIQKNPGRNEIVLTTCYPLGFSSQRLNIIATPS